MDGTPDPSNHADSMAQNAEPGDRASNGSVRGDDTETPACQSCRKRKLKCSRDTPVCSQCARLKCTCLYDRKKQKPGLKTGAVENLNQRLEVLEKILLDSDGNRKPLSGSEGNQGCLYHAAVLLARELEPRVEYSDDHIPEIWSGSNRQKTLNCEETSPNGSAPYLPPVTQFSRKRKRRSSIHELARDDVDQDDLLSSLPSTPVLNAAVDAFFARINHWIPFLHPPRFNTAVKTQQLRQEDGIILHAIVSTTLKYLEKEQFNLTQAEIDRQVRFSRNAVMLTAMDSLTIEGIESLIIIAFNWIGSGKVSKAWPIIGSLTRTVEYLQLTIEPDMVQQYSLSAPLSLLNAASDWTDTEHRRRVFWNVFLLDRFCSVSTGWSTSLTSDDVRRRLPCDWGLWHGEEAVQTPYFGIWNKAAARIGNSVAYIPAHYPSPEHAISHCNLDGATNIGSVDTSKLGAFAYCIEATESLSQVSTFFLQQRVDLRSTKEVTSWLTRFKELDLRLVHWKMFLPQKWKDSNISRGSALVNMDPNLTLAHITHNTSMILLHQHIAYPSPKLTEMIELPSSCSAETCRLAAVETASISQKYLTHTKTGVVNSQFALCVFVAARILLVRWRFSTTELLPEFFNLVDSLDTMSIMWRGEQQGEDETPVSDLDLAGMYALHLRSLHQKCLSSPDFIMDPSYGVLLPPLAVPTWSTTWQFVSSPFQHNFTERELPGAINSPQQSQQLRNLESRYSHRQASFPYGTTSTQANHSPNPSTQSPSAVYPPVPIHSFPEGNQPLYSSPSNTFAQMNGRLSIGHPGIIPGNNNVDELAEMSSALLGQQFLEMDRVISLDDADFALNLHGWGHGA